LRRVNLDPTGLALQSALVIATIASRTIQSDSNPPEHHREPSTHARCAQRHCGAAMNGAIAGGGVPLVPGRRKN
jgi:hypothetical protein